MIKLLIVEDEYLQRELLKNVVDWSLYDTVIVGETDNSADAVRLAEREQPDVIFLDIVINGENGLKAAKKIRAAAPYCQIIIITAYGTFDFAREAIQAGVCGYLLKPIDPDELVPLFREAGEKALYDKKRAAYEQDLIRQKQLFEVLSGVGELSPDIFSSLGIGEEGFLNVAYIIFPGAISSFPQAAAESVAENVRQSYPAGIAVRAANAMLLILIEKGGSLFSFSLETEIFISETMQLLSDNGISGCLMSRSSSYASVKDLNTAFEEAKSRMAARENKNGYSVTPGADSEAVNLLYARIAAFKKDMEFPFASGTTESAQVSFETLVRDTASIKIHWTEKYHIYDHLFSILDEALVRSNCPPSPETVSQLHKVLGKLGESSSSEVVRDTLTAIGREYFLALCKARSTPAKKKVNAALEYIRQNYSDPNLSLRSVADATHVNPCYLSSIFKSETGQSFTDYLTRLRLDRANELIRKHREKPLYMVAEEVGYLDYYYFCRRYRQVFGISPSETL